MILLLKGEMISRTCSHRFPSASACGSHKPAHPRNPGETRSKNTWKLQGRASSSLTKFPIFDSANWISRNWLGGVGRVLAEEPALEDLDHLDLGEEGRLDQTIVVVASALSGITRPNVQRGRSMGSIESNWKLRVRTDPKFAIDVGYPSIENKSC